MKNLVAALPAIVELDEIPPAPPAEPLPALDPQRKGNKINLNHPLAWGWLKTDRRGHLDRELDYFIRQTWGYPLPSRRLQPAGVPQ